MSASGSPFGNRISIHVPREGDDRDVQASVGVAALFLSTSPARGTTPGRRGRNAGRPFLSTSPARGTTVLAVFSTSHLKFLSTSPARGTTRTPTPSFCWRETFLSTSPARGTTRPHRTWRCRCQHFYPRPPRGGRRIQLVMSIGPVNFYPRPPRGGRPGRFYPSDGVGQFLSTSPARGTTLYKVFISYRQPYISIHVPREGDDLRRVQRRGDAGGISIHVPREGDD